MDQETNSKIYFYKAGFWTYVGVVALDIFLENGYNYESLFITLLIGAIFCFFSGKIFYFFFGYFLTQRFDPRYTARDLQKILDLRGEVRKFQIITGAIVAMFIVASIRRQYPY